MTASGSGEDGGAGASELALVALGGLTRAAAHELRNPLAGISGALQVIAGRLPIDAAERPILDELQSRLAAVDRIVEDLLVLGRLRRPVAASPRLVDALAGAPAVAGRVLGSASPTLALRGLPAADALQVVGDASLLTLLFGHLLATSAAARNGGNADGAVPVDAAREDDAVSLHWDCGPAVAPDAILGLFEPFARLHGRELGLSLVIAHTIAALHAASLTADTRNHRTVVSVSLPVAS